MQYRMLQTNTCPWLIRRPVRECVTWALDCDHVSGCDSYHIVHGKRWEACIDVLNEISYFSTKTYVVGAQKNRLSETVLLSTQNICLN